LSTGRNWADDFGGREVMMTLMKHNDKNEKDNKTVSELPSSEYNSKAMGRTMKRICPKLQILRK
jgi:hypothetical protein